MHQLKTKGYTLRFSVAENTRASWRIAYAYTLRVCRGVLCYMGRARVGYCILYVESIEVEE